MICLSFILTGAYFSKQAKRRVFILERLSELFSAFAFSAGSGGKDINNICKEICMLDKFECFSFPESFLSSFYEGCDLCVMWCESIEKARELNCLKNEEREALKSFSQVFFVSGIDEFSDTCNRLSEKFRLLTALSHEQVLKNQKIFISGSVLAAAAFFIISF